MEDQIYGDPQVYFASKLRFASEKATVRKQVVVLGKSLRSDIWVVDGDYLHMDIQVNPSGDAVALTSLGRRMLKC